MTSFILGLSILIQVAAAILALRPISRFGSKLPWYLLSAAILLMAVRRAITFSQILAGSNARPPDPVAESVALVISILMLAGIAGLHRLSRQSTGNFERISNAMREAMSVITRDGVFLYANKVATNILSLGKLDDLTGRPIGEFISPDQSQRLIERLRRTLDTGTTSVDDVVVTIGGEDRWFHNSLEPIRYGAKETPALLSVSLDITDRKRVEEALRESEAMHRAFLEAMPLPVFCKDECGRYTRMNQAFCTFYGQSEENLVGKTVFDIAPRELADVYHAKDEEILRQPGVQIYESQVRDANGENHDVVFHKATILSTLGKPVGLIGAILDATERKQAEERLKSSEALFRTAFLASPDAVNINRLDDGIYVAINQGFTRIMGYTEEDVIGKSSQALRIWKREEDRNKLLSGLQSAGHIEGLEAVFRSKDGTYKTGLMSAAIIELKGTKHILSITRDITSHRTLEERMRQMEKMDAIGHLAGGVAHDFNNQLAGVLGYGDMLVKRLDDPNLRRYAENICTAARRSADLTKKLLAFSRQGQYQSVPVDIHSLLTETVELLMHSVDKRIMITQKLHARHSFTSGDPTQLQNALLNLTINACDAMPEGGELILRTEVIRFDPATCGCSEETRGENFYLLVSVEDNGSGIPPEVKPHIFEPFFTTKEMGKGTGMGLAAVYGTVKQHKGYITCYSEVGRGTTFNLYLPLRDSYLAVQDQSLPAQANDRQLTILVVDDEEMLRDYVQDMLKGFGHNVLTAPDGQVGIELYRERWSEIDLVILDMVMPNVDGRDTFRAMKKINPGVKAILSSGYSLNERAQAILSEGVQGFAQKPYDSSQLTEIIRIVTSGGYTAPARPFDLTR